MLITTAKKKNVLGRVEDRKQYLSHKGVVACMASMSLLQTLDAEAENFDEYASLSEDKLPPEKHFHPELIECEGYTFFEILKDALKCMGGSSTYQRGKSLPLFVATLLYIPDE